MPRFSVWSVEVHWRPRSTRSWALLVLSMIYLWFSQNAFFILSIKLSTFSFNLIEWVWPVHHDCHLPKHHLMRTPFMPIFFTVGKVQSSSPRIHKVADLLWSSKLCSMMWFRSLVHRIKRATGGRQQVLQHLRYLSSMLLYGRRLSYSISLSYRRWRWRCHLRKGHGRQRHERLSKKAELLL